MAGVDLNKESLSALTTSGIDPLSQFRIMALFNKLPPDDQNAIKQKINDNPVAAIKNVKEALGASPGEFLGRLEKSSEPAADIKKMIGVDDNTPRAQPVSFTQDSTGNARPIPAVNTGTTPSPTPVATKPPMGPMEYQDSLNKNFNDFMAKLDEKAKAGNGTAALMRDRLARETGRNGIVQGEAARNEINKMGQDPRVLEKILAGVDKNPNIGPQKFDKLWPYARSTPEAMNGFVNDPKRFEARIDRQKTLLDNANKASGYVSPTAPKAAPAAPPQVPSLQNGTSADFSRFMKQLEAKGGAGNDSAIRLADRIYDRIGQNGSARGSDYAAAFRNNNQFAGKLLEAVEKSPKMSDKKLDEVMDYLDRQVDQWKNGPAAPAASAGAPAAATVAAALPPLSPEIQAVSDRLKQKVGAAPGSETANDIDGTFARMQPHLQALKVAAPGARTPDLNALDEAMDGMAQAHRKDPDVFKKFNKEWDEKNAQPGNTPAGLVEQFTKENAPGQAGVVLVSQKEGSKGLATPAAALPPETLKNLTDVVTKRAGIDANSADYKNFQKAEIEEFVQTAVSNPKIIELMVAGGGAASVAAENGKDPGPTDMLKEMVKADPHMFRTMNQLIANKPEAVSAALDMWKKNPEQATTILQATREVGMVNGRFRPGFAEFMGKAMTNPEIMDSMKSILKNDGKDGKGLDELKKQLKEHPDLFEQMNQVVDRNPRAAKKIFGQLGAGDFKGGMDTFTETVSGNMMIDFVADVIGMFSPQLGAKFRNWADNMRDKHPGMDKMMGKMAEKMFDPAKPEEKKPDEKKTNDPAATPDHKHDDPPATRTTTTEPPKPAATPAAEPVTFVIKPDDKKILHMLSEDKIRIEGGPVYRDPTEEERRRMDEFHRSRSYEIKNEEIEEILHNTPEGDSRRHFSSGTVHADRYFGQPSQGADNTPRPDGIGSTLKVNQGSVLADNQFRDAATGTAAAPEPAAGPAIRGPEKDDLLRKSGFSIV